MNGRAGVESWANFLDRVVEGAEEGPPQYESHPTIEVLRAYGRRELPTDSDPSSDRLQALEQGHRTDWRQVEVGVHVKTCPSCARSFAELESHASAKTSHSRFQPLSPWRKLKQWMQASGWRSLQVHAISYGVAGVLIGVLYFLVSPSADSSTVVLEGGPETSSAGTSPVGAILVALVGLWALWGLLGLGSHAYWALRRNDGRR